jgi:hypothetical protein
MASSKGRREFWECVVARERESELTGRSWCRENGIPVAAFYRWRKKLSANASPDVASSHRSSDIQWLPIPSVSPVPNSACAISASSGVTLRIGAVSVDISTAFDTRVLSEVLTVLESRC